MVTNRNISDVLPVGVEISENSLVANNYYDVQARKRGYVRFVNGYQNHNSVKYLKGYINMRDCLGITKEKFRVSDGTQAECGADPSTVVYLKFGMYDPSPTGTGSANIAFHAVWRFTFYVKFFENIPLGIS